MTPLIILCFLNSLSIFALWYTYREDINNIEEDIDEIKRNSITSEDE